MVRRFPRDEEAAVRGMPRDLTESGLAFVIGSGAEADDEITIAETNVLRATTTALGLTQSDFNTSQARHRDSCGC